MGGSAVKEGLLFGLVFSSLEGESDVYCMTIAAVHVVGSHHDHMN
jgi:hypothetical protein